MDRPIRPLFPQGFANEVQCQSIVFSSDRQVDGDVLAMNGVAAALFISALPFRGPVASVRIGRVEGQFIPFPTHDQLEESDLDLIVSGSDLSVCMIEGFAREMPEDEMAASIQYAHGVIREVLAMQRELYEKVNPTKMVFVPPPDDGVYDKLRSKYYEDFKAAKQTTGKQARAEAVETLKNRVVTEMIPDAAAADAICPDALDHAWHSLEARVMRDLILSGTRAGRPRHEDLAGYRVRGGYLAAHPRFCGLSTR